MGLHKVPWLKALEFLVHSLKLCKNLSNIRSKFSSWCGYLKSATVGMPRVCNRKEKQRKAIAKLQGKTRSLPWSGREECSKDVTNDVIVSVWRAFWVYNHKELAHIHKFVYNSQWGFLHRSCKLLQKKQRISPAKLLENNTNSTEGPLIFPKGHAAFTFHKAVHLLNFITSLLFSNSEYFSLALK